MILGLGLFLGIGLSVILLGLLILAFLLVFVRTGVAFERWLAEKLLGITVEAPEDAETVRDFLDAPSTWRGFGFLSLKFWLGIVGIILIFGVSTAWSMVSSLIDRPTCVDLGEVNGEPVVWTVETLPEAVVATTLGLMIVIVLVHLANLFCYIAGRMAVALLQ